MADPVRWQDRWWHQQPDGTWLLFNEQTQAWEPYGTAISQPIYAPAPGLSTGAKWGIGLGIGAAVLLIIMILAAIAIPVFLRQREKGWTDQVEGVLKNAAIAQESYLIHAGTYAESPQNLEDQGLIVPPDISLTIVEASKDRYCMEAAHEMIPGDIWSYDSTFRRPREGPCL